MFDFDTIPERRGTFSHKWDLVASPDAIAMSVADSDFLAPSFIRNALIDCTARPVFGYTFWPPSAVDATVNWLDAQHGWKIDRGSVLLCTGVLTGLRATMAALLQPGDGVVINTPAYAPFASLTASNGYDVLESPLQLVDDQYSIDFIGLEQLLSRPETKLLILCNPHNPVGRVYKRAELERVSELCLHHGVRVASDEIHCDIVFSENKHVPIASLSPDAAANCVTLISPSKTFNIAGFSSAAIICHDASLRERIEFQLKSVGNYLPDPFAIAAYEAAFTLGHDYALEMVEYVQSNLSRACEFISSRCQPLKARRPQGTCLLWINCEGLALADDELSAFFTESAKVVLQSGLLFGPQGSGFMRLNAACPRSVLDIALGRIEAAVANHIKQSS